MPTPTVFISYSHIDEEWKDRVVKHLTVLQQEGMLDIWDDRRIEAGGNWYPQILEEINAASIAILLISANFLASKFILNEEVPRLMQRREREGIRVIPLIIKPCTWQRIGWLSHIQARPKDGRALSSGDENRIDEDLAAFSTEIAGFLKHSKSTTHPSTFVSLQPDKVSLAKLPSTSPDLFGRKNELEIMDRAWDDPKTNILSLVAWGGVGKSALVNKWLINLGNNYRGATRVFGWSFYSQGAVEGRQISADPFITKSLEWFGDKDPTAGSPWDKGQRLADLIKSERTLLILDGLEPLQSPPPDGTGRIKDPSMQCMLRELAHNNPGLVVITTRLDVDDLKDFRHHSVEEIDLNNLSPTAGAEYLRHIGVKGRFDELKQASTEFGGHALALTLLGNYLKTIYQGDVRQRDRITKLFDERRQGAHAKRVMETYEEWFSGKPELEILYIMGLFDRPAEQDALSVITANPRIAGLTGRLQDPLSSDWKFVVDNLRFVHLIEREDPDNPQKLDCHPLIREYFGDKLKEKNPEAWRIAHSRLYEQYKTSADQYPDTMEGMSSLYTAIRHGCLAGRHMEALTDIYWARIQRKQEFFSKNKLGAFGSDLAALANYYKEPWYYPLTKLDDRTKSFILNETGSALQSLGRMKDATQPIKAALDIDLLRNDFENASISSVKLCSAFLVVGELTKAIDFARKGTELADQGGKNFMKIVSRAKLAESYHQAGDFENAKHFFYEAEKIQKEWKQDFSFLYSLAGFRYCEFLLDFGDFDNVIRRASQTLKVSRQQGWLLDEALDNLSLGCALLMRARDHKGGGEQAAKHLGEAVDGLRHMRSQDLLPLGLLARAKFYQLENDQARAKTDLDEAFFITNRSEMRLYEADCHINYFYVYLSMGEIERANQSYENARQIIAETGYHRRDPDIADIAKKLLSNQ